MTAQEREGVADDEALARRAAHILGPQSGAAQALARMEALRAAGHDTHILLRNQTWLVKEPSV